MRRGLVLLVLCACGEPPGDSASALRQPIVGGALDTGDPEAFMMQFQLFGLPNMCSAVLVGRRTLVTASHCVAAGTGFRAVNLPRGRSAPAIEIVDLRTHPGWSWGTASANDIAVGLLKTAPGIAPKPRATAPPPAGGLLRVIGYGYTAEEDYTSWGDKHAVEVPARAIDSRFIMLGDGVEKGFCNGDSGGPSFHRFPDGVERLVGIHIEGSTCTDGRDVRVDVHAGFIDGYLAEKEGAVEVPVPAREPATPVEPLGPAAVEPVDLAPPHVAAPSMKSQVEPQPPVYLRPACGCRTGGLAPLVAVLWLLAVPNRSRRGSA